MRTTFDAPNERRSINLSRRRVTLLLLLTAIALGLILLDEGGQLDPVKGRAQAILQPIEQTLTQTRIAVGETIGSVTGMGTMQRQIDALEREVSALREENIRLKTYQNKIGLLEQELQIRQTYNWQTLSATVVRGSTDNGRRIVRISRGRVDGIAPGMGVVSKEGGSPAALIGVVDRVYAQTADVLLITDYGSTISARTAGTETPAEGLIAGQWQLGSRIKLTDVSRDVPLEIGQYIVTAGLSKALATDTPIAQVPPDVPIGTIISVSQTGHSQTAEVQPFVDPDRVRNIWVITGQK
ncbi:MAG TPA: rod shape-determining protein MreC [Herpetosiphonaceae bacterium]